MSSANRGRERNKDDLYETPYWFIEAQIQRIKELLKAMILDERGMRTEPIVILEPCAGNGRISRVLKHFFPEPMYKVIATDIQAYDGLDMQVDFLELMLQDLDVPNGVDLVVTNPPFCLAEPIIKHAQGMVHPGGFVMPLERMNFLGSKKREPWIRSGVPDFDLSPRRASFLPTGQTDSIEYGWMKFLSNHCDPFPHGVRHMDHGELRMMRTMECYTCKEVQYEKACGGCDYVYCKDCFIDHTHEDCRRNLFGKEALWFCLNHPDRPMTNACRRKGCALPFCAECWTKHAAGKWRACDDTN